MSDIRARDIMNADVKTIGDRATLGEAAEFLIANNISGVPVVDADGLLVGVISEADLMDEKKRKMGIPRMALYGLWIVPEKLLKESYDEGFGLSVRDLMTRDVLTASEETPLHELADLMLAKKINRIPIVREGKVVGIVTRDNVLQGLVRGRRQ